MPGQVSTRRRWNRQKQDQVGALHAAHDLGKMLSPTLRLLGAPQRSPRLCVSFFFLSFFRILSFALPPPNALAAAVLFCKMKPLCPNSRSSVPPAPSPAPNI